jgi:hypothetical protein
VTKRYAIPEIKSPCCGLDCSGIFARDDKPPPTLGTIIHCYACGRDSEVVADGLRVLPESRG